MRRGYFLLSLPSQELPTVSRALFLPVVAFFVFFFFATGFGFGFGFEALAFFLGGKGSASVCLRLRALGRAAGDTGEELGERSPTSSSVASPASLSGNDDVEGIGE